MGTPFYIVVHTKDSVSMVAYGYGEVKDYINKKGLSTLDDFKKLAEGKLIAKSGDKKVEIYVAEDRDKALEIAVKIAKAVA